MSDESFYIKVYMFIKGYATSRNMINTLKALPLAKAIHNGQYRKGTIMVDGVECRLPYVLHVLKVASTLLSLNLPITNEELDILICAALLHDSLEDGSDFLSRDYDLVAKYGIAEESYQIIKLLSKRKGATEQELEEYFNKIKNNKFALLLKMADRSHNVEDLYNMKLEKLHKYVKETRTFVYPLSSYAKEYYPELSNGVTILKSKIVSLTGLTETLVDLYETNLPSNISENISE